jgi:diguanylate cyclase (GGDEF)-like protein
MNEAAPPGYRPDCDIGVAGVAAQAGIAADGSLAAHVRQDYLEALPIAAGVFRLDAIAGALLIDLANHQFAELSGWQGQSGSAADALDFLQESGLTQTIADFLAADGQILQFETGDGNAVGGRHFLVRMARLRAFPGLGCRCLVSLIDRTAQVETERSLRSEMLRDSLTGLPNRLAFNEEVEKVLEGDAFLPGSHAVLVVDMTRFSRVNECVGSIAGDELLITFARRLHSSLRAGDILARTGGDEFGLLVRLEKGLEDALQAAERIRSTLAAPFRLSELEIRVDCAIGCALLGGGEEMAEEVLRNAQFALKRAKHLGATQIYEPVQAQAARRRFSLETDLRRAIEAEELTLAFQPLVELGTGRSRGGTATLRAKSRRVSSSRLRKNQA